MFQLKDGKIEIKTDNIFLQIEEISQAYLVLNAIQRYRNEIKDEQTFHAYYALFDSYCSILNLFVREKEKICLRN